MIFYPQKLCNFLSALTIWVSHNVVVLIKGNSIQEKNCDVQRIKTGEQQVLFWFFFPLLYFRFVRVEIRIWKLSRCWWKQWYYWIIYHCRWKGVLSPALHKVISFWYPFVLIPKKLCMVLMIEIDSNIDSF